MGNATVTSEQLSKILDQLSSDDQFREAMLGDPVSALARHGVKVDPSSVPTVRCLPSKDALRGQRDALKNKIEGKAGLALFLLTP
jgi:putative modified peptide